MTRLPLIVLITLFLPLPALADEWSHAVYAELQEENPTKALRLYAKVRDDLPERAAEATYRRAVVLARKGDLEGLRAEIAQFKDSYPDSKLLKPVERIEKNPKACRKSDKAGSWSDQVDEILTKRKVTLNFDETPLSEVIGFLQDITGLNIVLLPDVDPKATISLRLRDISLENALKLIKAGHDLSHELRCESIVIGKDPGLAQPLKFTKEGVANYPDLFVALKERSVTVNFPATPLSEVVTFLQDITGLNLHLSKVNKKAPVDLRLRDVKLESALALILAQTGTRLRWTPRVLVIEQNKDS